MWSPVQLWPGMPRLGMLMQWPCRWWRESSRTCVEAACGTMLAAKSQAPTMAGCSSPATGRGPRSTVSISARSRTRLATAGRSMRPLNFASCSGISSGAWTWAKCPPQIVRPDRACRVAAAMSTGQSFAAGARGEPSVSRRAVVSSMGCTRRMPWPALVLVTIGSWKSRTWPLDASKLAATRYHTLRSRGLPAANRSTAPAPRPIHIASSPCSSMNRP